MNFKKKKKINLMNVSFWLNEIHSREWNSFQQNIWPRNIHSIKKCFKTKHFKRTFPIGFVPHFFLASSFSSLNSLLLILLIMIYVQFSTVANRIRSAYIMASYVNRLGAISQIFHEFYTSFQTRTSEKMKKKETRTLIHDIPANSERRKK